MARRLPGMLPVALGLLAAACADQNSSGPAAPHADGIAAVQTSIECSFTAFNPLIAQYFTTSARQQKASGFVNAMQAGGPFSPGAVDNGFELLDEIAQTVDSTYNGLGTSGSAATGSSLVQTTISCMYDDLGTLPDFTVSVDPTSKGAFQVRPGIGTDVRPVLARSDVGAEPISGVSPSTSNWGSIIKAADGTTATRALIYGTPIFSDPLNPTVPDPLKYQWEAIRPDIIFTPPGAVVAICAAGGAADWVQESNVGVLAFQSGADLCQPRALATVGGWRPSVLAYRLLDLLQPRPLNAAMATTSIGGGAGGLKSIFSSKTIPSAKLKFIPPIPTTVKANSPIALTVEARSADGVLMNGVGVTYTGSNNNGTPTLLVKSDGTSCGTATPPTGITGAFGAPTGQVTIYFCDTKAGGLILTASGTGHGTTFAAVKTKLNVKP